MHSCVSTCSTGFYLSNNNERCLPCHETCLNCTSSTELSCTSCKLGYVLLDDSHRCEKHTGKPYYIDIETGETHTCHSSCKFCNGPQPNNCLACRLNERVLLDDGNCVHECPLETFRSERKTIDYQTQFCSPCSEGCLKCINSAQCQRCDQNKGFKLVNNVCVAICPSG